MRVAEALPRDTAAERGLLGCILAEGRVPAGARIAPDLLYWPLHRAIYSAMLVIHDRGHQITPCAVVAQMHLDGTGWMLGRDGERVH